jgi:hypothetical protein
MHAVQISAGLICYMAAAWKQDVAPVMLAVPVSRRDYNIKTTAKIISEIQKSYLNPIFFRH